MIILIVSGFSGTCFLILLELKMIMTLFPVVCRVSTGRQSCVLSMEIKQFPCARVITLDLSIMETATFFSSLE